MEVIMFLYFIYLALIFIGIPVLLISALVKYLSE